MSRQAQKKLTEHRKHITDAKEWADELEASRNARGNGGGDDGSGCLVVVDVFNHVFGPCDQMAPVISEYMMTVDNQEAVRWRMLNISAIEDKLRKVVKERATKAREREMARKHANADAESDNENQDGGGDDGDEQDDAEEEQVTLPALEKYAGYMHPRPLFVFIKNGAVVGELRSANPPLLRRMLAEHLGVMQESDRDAADQEAKDEEATQDEEKAVELSTEAAQAGDESSAPPAPAAAAAVTQTSQDEDDVDENKHDHGPEEDGGDDAAPAPKQAPVAEDKGDSALAQSPQQQQEQEQEQQHGGDEEQASQQDKGQEEVKQEETEPAEPPRAAEAAVAQAAWFPGPGTLVVTVVEAKDLLEVEKKQDPYVRIDIRDKKQESKTHKDGGKAPQWHSEQLQWKLDSPPKDDEHVVIGIYDQDLGRDDFIAHVGIPLAEFVKNGQKWYPLTSDDANTKPAGELLIGAEWQPSGEGHLEIHIGAAQKLAQADKKMDPYVSIEVRGKKQRTKAIKDAHDSANFVEDLTFALSSPPSAQDFAIVTVADEDIGKDDFIGRTEIPLLDLIDEGTKAWYDLASNDGKGTFCGELELKGTFKRTGDF